MNGKDYGEDFKEEIVARTGIDTRYTKMGHIIRGGNPTLRDRLTATQMGAKAVELLLAGQSNVVICEIDGVIKPIDINFSLILDRMYKNKLKDGDLDKYSAEEIAQMEAICQKRRDEIEELYKIANDIAI
jgi:6-phosphofructokinase